MVLTAHMQSRAIVLVSPSDGFSQCGPVSDHHGSHGAEISSLAFQSPTSAESQVGFDSRSRSKPSQ